MTLVLCRDDAFNERLLRQHDVTVWKGSDFGSIDSDCSSLLAYDNSFQSKVLSCINLSTPSTVLFRSLARSATVNTITSSRIHGGIENQDDARTMSRLILLRSVEKVAHGRCRR